MFTGSSLAASWIETHGVFLNLILVLCLICQKGYGVFQAVCGKRARCGTRRWRPSPGRAHLRKYQCSSNIAATMLSTLKVTQQGIHRALVPAKRFRMVPRRAFNVAHRRAMDKTHKHANSKTSKYLYY